MANAKAHEELRRLLAELAAWRVRIGAVADRARRRIERDLHDGAQQHLLMLTLQLQVAQDSVPTELGELQAELGRVVTGLTNELDEPREYAYGIHPAILDGLAPALKALPAARRCRCGSMCGPPRGCPKHVEVAAYYGVSEALTNAAKHANASAVHVDVEAVGGIVQLSVSDDGVGGAEPARGSGLAGLRDRVEAIGGTLIARSGVGAGTSLIAGLPARSFQDAAEIKSSRSTSLA